MIKNCELCKKEFEVNSKNKRSFNKRFCSKTCSSRNNGLNNSGRNHSEEFKNRMSIINTGKNNPFYGKKHSQQTKRILSDKLRWGVEDFNSCEFSESQIEFINGMMLSDFHIEESSTSNISGRFTFGFKFEDTIYDIFNELCNINFSPIYKDKNTNCFHSKSHTYKEIGDLRKIWYRSDRIKIIPKDLRLTPKTVKWWFIGDGFTADYNPQLSTDAFLKDDIDFLVSEFNNINIHTIVTKRNRIKIRSKSSWDFYDYMGNDFPKQYTYKITNLKERLRKR